MAGINEYTARVIDFTANDFNIEHVRQDLEDFGVAVISNVISQDDCDTYRRQIHQWLDGFRDNFPTNVHSIIHKYGVAHLEPAWRARVEAKKVFSLLWGTDKLMTSTDGIAVGRPPEEGHTEYGDPLPQNGLHFDQGPRRQGLHAYQGAVYLEEATLDDWCFIAMIRTNKYHQEFFEKFKSSRGSEFRKLNAGEISWLEERGCTLHRVAVPKGGLLLWDSRTVHNGAGPRFGRQNQNRWRYVVFVCQTPAIWATPDDIDVKKDAYTNLKCSRHWASSGVSNFKSGTSIHDIKEHNEFTQSDEVRRLAGDLPYDFHDGQSNGPEWTPHVAPLPKYK